MAVPFADRLAAAVRGNNTPLCVGIDPRLDLLPSRFRRFADDSLEGAAAAYRAFGERVLELIADLVGVVKVQAAFFEALGPAGMSALQALLSRAKEMGFVTILDGKRNDIASTATAYADAAFTGCSVGSTTHRIWGADSLTINPYLGRDAVEPFLTSARRVQGGVFVLVRTSNPGAGLFQDLDCGGRPLYEHVGLAVGEWNASGLGACGLGDVGAVVGATHPAELIRLRELLPAVWFLVPGFGAQGGTARDVLPAVRADGLGAVINSSRGITFPTYPDDPAWEDAVRTATRRAIDALRG